MSFEIFTEYRIAGRGTAFGVVIPVEDLGDEVVVNVVSHGAHRKTMDKDELNEHINNRLFDSDVNKSYVKQEELNPEVCRRMDEFLQKNDGSVSNEEWTGKLERVKESLN